jgi:hypothetical protein
MWEPFHVGLGPQPMHLDIFVAQLQPRNSANSLISSGVGAIGRANMNCLHPSQTLRDRYSVGRDLDYIDGLCILRADLGKVSRGGRIVN